MGKLGEINYLRTLSPEEVRGLAHKPFSEPAAARNLQEMAALFALLPPGPVRLLDLGCGPGWTSLFFARAGHQVVGVDICPDMIRLADEQRRRLGVDHATFLVRDYEELDFDAEFDVVVFFDSLHHAVDEELALGRAYRALGPGGLCLTSEPGEGHSTTTLAAEAVRRYGVTEKDMPPRKIRDLGRRLGFRSSSSFPFGWNNQLYPYSHGEAVEPPLPGGGPLKRLFHWFVRRGLRLSPREYAALMAVRYRLPTLTDCDRVGGITCLVK
jgi:SAM-dependent methyltransferase